MCQFSDTVVISHLQQFIGCSLTVTQRHPACLWTMNHKLKISLGAFYLCIEHAGNAQKQTDEQKDSIKSIFRSPTMLVLH